MNRRKLFKLIAGAIAAPKELLAARSFTTPVYQFGFTGYKYLPETRIFRCGSDEPGVLYWLKPPDLPPYVNEVLRKQADASRKNLFEVLDK